VGKEIEHGNLGQKRGTHQGRHRFDGLQNFTRIRHYGGRRPKLMNSNTSYWGAVQGNRVELAATGEKFFYVTSLDSWRINSSGAIAQVGLETAAQNIARESHRLSTPVEIKSHLESQELALKAIVSGRITRAQAMVMLTPAEAFGDVPGTEGSE
jgi:hypothetical protein